MGQQQVDLALDDPSPTENPPRKKAMSNNNKRDQREIVFLYFSLKKYICLILSIKARARRDEISCLYIWPFGFIHPTRVQVVTS